MLDIDIATIKRKSIVGVMALTSRTFFLGLVGLISNQILLPLFLSADTFGLYIVVSAIISFLGYFSDIGLAASLIQKKEVLTDEDTATTFTIQQILVGTSVLIALLFSTNIAAFYRLDISGLWLLRALIVSFFLSSLKTIPSILLERKLAFDKLVVPTIVESLGFYIVVVFLAWRGFGVQSFTAAVLVRGVLGLFAIYMVEPWPIRIGISKNVAKRLLKFGIPFQANSFLALLKDDLMTLFLGRVLPFAQVGYIGWGKKFAEVPLRLFMDNVIRITFPAFARMQHEVNVLGSAIEKTLYGLSISTFPVFCVLLFFIRQMVFLIPKYAKWQQALPTFYLFVIVSVIACLNTPLSNALNAIGKVKITLMFMIAYVVLTWILTVIGLRLFGFNGFAIAMVIIAMTLVFMVQVVKKYIPFKFFYNIKTAFFGSLLQAIVYYSMLSIYKGNFVWLAITGAIGFGCYLLAVYIIDKKRITDFIMSIRIK
jgi:O-antigen/teichoic acid export membrane protein